MRGFFLFVVGFIALLSCVPAGAILFNAFFYDEASLSAFASHALVVLLTLLWIYAALRLVVYALDRGIG